MHLFSLTRMHLFSLTRMHLLSLHALPVRRRSAHARGSPRAARRQESLGLDADAPFEEVPSPPPPPSPY